MRADVHVRLLLRRRLSLGRAMLAVCLHFLMRSIEAADEGVRAHHELLPALVDHQLEMLFA